MTQASRPALVTFRFMGRRGTGELVTRLVIVSTSSHTAPRPRSRGTQLPPTIERQRSNFHSPAPFVETLGVRASGMTPPHTASPTDVRDWDNTFNMHPWESMGTTPADRMPGQEADRDVTG